jgi:hypothetical protein
MMPAPMPSEPMMGESSMGGGMSDMPASDNPM